MDTLADTMEAERQRLNKVLEDIAQKRITLDQEERSARIELAGIQAYLDLAHHAIMRLYEEDVINVTTIPDVLHEWKEPTHDWGEKSIYRLFNATTFALAGKVLEKPTITKTLHQVCDDVYELAH